MTEASWQRNATAYCNGTYDGGRLYVFVAIGMIVGYPLLGYIFDSLSTLRQKLYLIVAAYILSAALSCFVPLASASWQYHASAFAIGLALSPHTLHLAFLDCLLGPKLYSRGLGLFVFLGAVMQAIALPVAGMFTRKCILMCVLLWLVHVPLYRR